MPKSKGFTLIELLVAVSIIGILSTAGIVIYGGTASKARDSIRKNDLREVATALELYYQKNGRYPCRFGTYYYQTSATLNDIGFWIEDTESGCPTPISLFDQSYINRMPVDPKANNFSETDNLTFGYAYTAYVSSAPVSECRFGQCYFLETRLENLNDPDSCKNKQYKNRAGTVFCADNSDAKNSLFIITSQ